MYLNAFKGVTYSCASEYTIKREPEVGTVTSLSLEVWTPQAGTPEVLEDLSLARSHRRTSVGTKATGDELLRGMWAAPCLGEGLKDIIGAQQQWGGRNRVVRWPLPCPLAWEQPQPAPPHTSLGHHRASPSTKDLPPAQGSFPQI